MKQFHVRWTVRLRGTSVVDAESEEEAMAVMEEPGAVNYQEDADEEEIESQYAEEI